MKLFEQGMFTVNPSASPDQLARKRERIYDLLAGNKNARYVGEGLGHLATGILGGKQLRDANTIENKGREGADNLFASLMGGTPSQATDTVSSRGWNPFGGGSQPPADPNSSQGIANETMATLDLPKTSSADYLRQGMIKRGLPEHVADGFIMNMQDESGLNPGINEANPIVAGSRGGYGLYQLTGPRRVAYEQFAGQRGANLDDVDTQLDFLMQELGGTESAAAREILSTKDSGSAGAAIVNKFLRPAEEHRASRTARYLGGQPREAMSAQNAPVQDNTADLQAALANPWLSPEQKAVISQQLQQSQRRSDMNYQAQLQQQDPMYQAKLNALQNPAPAARKTIKGADGYNYYTDTNERVLPDVVAKEETPLVDMSGMSLGGAGETAFSKTTGAELAKSTSALAEAGDAARRNVVRIDRLEGLLGGGGSGFIANAKRIASDWGLGSIVGASDIEAAQAVISSLVPEQRPPGSGTMSDADLALFKQSLPRIINTEGGNKKIIDTLRGIAQYDMQRGDIARKLQLNKITPEDAFAAYGSLENPLGWLNGGDEGWTDLGNGVRIRQKN